MSISLIMSRLALVGDIFNPSLVRINESINSYFR